MPRLLALIAMLGCLSLLPACGGSDSAEDASSDSQTPAANDEGPEAAEAEQLVANLLGDLNKMTDRVATVKDTVTAAQAAPDLKPYINKFKEYAAQYEQVKPATESATASLMEKYGGEIESVMGRLNDEIARLEGLSPLIANTVKPIVEQINSQIQSIGLPALQPTEAEPE